MIQSEKTKELVKEIGAYLYEHGFTISNFDYDECLDFLEKNHVDESKIQAYINEPLYVFMELQRNYIAHISGINPSKLNLNKTKI